MSVILWTITITTMYTHLSFFRPLLTCHHELSLCFFFYCIFALFVLVPDFYHHSQADYNVHCATVNLSYVMNINVVGLLGGTQHTSVTWDEGSGGGKGVLPPSLVFAWMFFVPNPGEDMTHLVKIYFPSNNFSHVLSPLCWCMCDER